MMSDYDTIMNTVERGIIHQILNRAESQNRLWRRFCELNRLLDSDLPVHTQPVPFYLATPATKYMSNKFIFTSYTRAGVQRCPKYRVQSPYPSKPRKPPPSPLPRASKRRTWLCPSAARANLG